MKDFDDASDRKTVDPAKLIAAAERLQKLVEEENAKREERLRKLDEKRQQMIETCDRLQKAIEETRIEQNTTLQEDMPVRKPITFRKPKAP